MIRRRVRNCKSCNQSYLVGRWSHRTQFTNMSCDSKSEAPDSGRRSGKPSSSFMIEGLESRLIFGCSMSLLSEPTKSCFLSKQVHQPDVTSFQFPCLPAPTRMFWRNISSAIFRHLEDRSYQVAATRRTSLSRGSNSCWATIQRHGGRRRGRGLRKNLRRHRRNRSASHPFPLYRN